MLVEFRHVSWLDEENRDETLRFLEELGAANVIVDSPRIEGAKNLSPTVVALTSPTAYVRFHGRNASTWNKRGGGASERFDYLYSDDELSEWVEPLRELAGQAEQAYAFFNNNATSPDGHGGRMAQAAANAKALQQLLAGGEGPGALDLMEILSIIHGEAVRAGVFADVVAERGHRLEEWSLAWGTPIAAAARRVRCRARLRRRDARRPGPASPVASRGERSSWNGSSTCARPCSASASVRSFWPRQRTLPSIRRAKPEIGWFRVELTDDAADDPVLGHLPRSFDAFQWHYYAHGVPAGAVELARSEVCTQAFRLGDNAWGVQFHPEVTLSQVEGWVTGGRAASRRRRRPPQRRHASGSTTGTTFGRDLCGAFVTAAERVAAAA